MYIFAYACACVCTSSVDRLRSYQPISFFENYSTRFSSKNPTPPPPHPPPFLSTGSIRHLVFSTSLTTRENERIIGQGTRVRSHMAPRFFQTFHPIPPPLPLFLEKKIARKLPIEERSRPWENVPLFLFFLFFLTFFYTFDQRYKEKKKKKKNRRAKFSQFFRSKNRTKENSKKRERRM